ncbi:E3 ubiquitin-protein ligase hrd1 [Penicillium longicatenatum]|uniref:E3 ubiquitin-protein ligase hrd1 n=1 Tax=Penicillium longicatenatum TaxID=1561947 RepID=UPI0025491944|nr:E3 ubiquitin-protein ligase hrd1 [Penicillium longicatenatum]KAJ5630487.1 E3 ubiquitin-protein ligase hrd1 [Penicillium longicatenatum]
MRLAAYAGASVVLATGVFLKALHQRSNFYAACVYLSQSSANLMILTNLCLIITAFILFWLQRLLYGPLRPIETEQLYERAWFAITETCLAMTIFRGELGGWFLVMFVSLLVGKVWGWIGEGRVEYLEQQPPANPRLFHIRLAFSLVLSVLFNAFMLRYCIDTVYHQARPDMMVMFGFEFAILTILSTSTTARYGIALTEIYITQQQLKAKMEERRAEIREARLEAIRANARAGESSPPTDLPDENDVNELEIDVPGWEEKGRWVFYLDLLTDFVKLLVYLVFFAILLTFYGLPIHILRDVVVTIRSFGRRIMDFLRYRNATRDMNERYPDATAEEVGREEVCIICREDMVPAHPAPAGGNAPPAANARPVPDRLRPKKLPCGHILHFACLRSWLERQQNCPTCRRPVVGAAAQGAGGNAGNGAGGQQNGAGNQAPGQPGQGDGLPRARVFQFGPFRIGFGAVRGDLLHNLHNQINQGNARPQPAANANPQGAHQAGLAFGFGRGPAPAPPGVAQDQPAASPSTLTNINSQLQQIEQQIAQEVFALRAATDQLRHVRSLQMELDRLRLNQTTTSTSATSPLPGTSSITTRQQFASSPGTVPLSAGDPRLPEGLNLPAGWTLVPLQPTNPNIPGPFRASSMPRAPPFPPGVHVPHMADPSLRDHPLFSRTFPSPTPTVPVANNDGQNSNNERTAANPAEHNTVAAETSPSLPSWGTSSLSAENHPADSLSQEWTDVQRDHITDATSSTAATCGSNTETETPEKTSVKETTTESESESASKGKSRAATVEEAEGDDAS